MPAHARLDGLVQRVPAADDKPGDSGWIGYETVGLKFLPRAPDDDVAPGLAPLVGIVEELRGAEDVVVQVKGLAPC